MKTIIFLTREFPLPGGRIGFTKDIIENLKDSFNFKIITFDMAPKGEGVSSFNSKENYEAEIIKIKKKYNHHNLNLIHFFIKSHKILKELKKKKEVDLVIGTGLSGLGGIIFAKNNKIPSIFNTSGIRGRNINDHMEYEIKTKKNTNEKIPRPKLTDYPRFALNYFTDRLSIFLSDYTTMPTYHLKEQIQKNKPKLYNKIKNKIKVIIEGLNTHKINKNLDKEKLLEEYKIKSDKVILFSRIENEEFSEELFKIVKKEIPNSTIISIDAARTTMRIDRGNGLEYTDMGPIKSMIMSDVMFCIPGSEPHSTLVLEALYNKCPTFVSNVGWLKYEFQDFPDFVVKELKIEKIISTIKKFYNKKEEFEEKSQEVMEKILEKNNFDKTSKEYEKFFKELMS
jgi:glycosyltransferase involved in cell wall biosynthesis